MLLHTTQKAALPVRSSRASRRRRRWPAGQVAPIVAGIIVVLVGAIALGTDLAVHYYNWVQLQKAADSGVLAGANSLPDNPTQAIATAKQFAQLNGVALTEITSTTVASNDLSISMHVQRTVPYYFARVLGMTNGTLAAAATAAPQPPTTTVGAPSQSSVQNGSYTPAACNNTGNCQVLPIGLDHNTVYSDGEQLTLQQGQVGPGNWDLLALGGVGGNNLRGNIADGYSGLLNVGDWILTEPGKKVGPVDQGFQDRLNLAASVDPTGTYSSHIGTNPRVIVLPIVDWEHQNGRKQVQIDAFATLWIDSYSGGQVTVHFISQVIANSFGSSSAPNFGGRGHPTLIQ
jgi:hypothetical protein